MQTITHSFRLRHVLLPLLCALLCVTSVWGQTLRVCYIPNSRSIYFDNGYTFDGYLMANHSVVKLTNLVNFGPNGTVKRSILPVPLTSNPITATTITSAGCNAIFVGSFGAGGIPIAELNVIRNWSMQIPTNLVVVSQEETKAWGYTNINGNLNPNVPTAAGAATKIFNGPFGVVTSFNQGGSYQGSIVGGTSVVLGEDAAKRPTIALDIPTGDIIVGDVDIFTAAGLSFGGVVSNNNDRLFANIWAYATDLTSTDRSLVVTANSVFIDNGLSAGTAGNCTKDGGESVPDVSTKPLYVKMVSGTSVIQITPLQPDGSFQFTSVPDGTYTLLLDDNNVVTDIVPVATGGTVSWTGTITSGAPSTPVKFCLLNCASNLPFASLTGSISFCAGQSAPLSVSASGGAGSYSYQWKQGSGNVGTNSNSFSATSAGVYSVAVTDGKGCLGTSTSLTITQRSFPVSITANGPTAILSNTLVILSTTALAGQIYQWSRDGVSISGATSNTFAAGQQGSYVVAVTGNGCSTTSTAVTISIILATEPLLIGLSINTYPNPTDGVVTIEVKNDSSQTVNLCLFNMNGQPIRTWELKASVHEQILQAELPTSGLYILRADNGQGALQKKIIRK
jgi:hypothetical protein